MKTSLSASRLREYSGRDSDLDHSDVSYNKCKLLYDNVSYCKKPTNVNLVSA